MRRLTLFCLIGVLGSLNLNAGTYIKWSVPHITASVKGSNSATQVETFFENASKTHSLTIKEVTTECGCAKLFTEKTTYLPGEKGILIGEIVVKDELVLDKKKITISGAILSEGKSAEFSESIDLYIKRFQSVKLSKSVLKWKQYSGKIALDTSVSRMNGQPFSVEIIDRNASLNFEVDLKSDEEKAIYHLEITPKETDRKLRSIIELVLTGEDQIVEREYLTLIIE